MRFAAAGIDDGVDRIVRMLPAWSASGGSVLVISLDGPGASGKTTYAAALAPLLGAAVVHTDDFFEPSSRRRIANLLPSERLASYYDWRRMRAEALVPLQAGRDATFSRYDWELDALSGPDMTVEARPVVLLEGVFSSSPQLGDLTDRSVLVDTPEHERLRRLRARISAEDWDDEWLFAEQAYFTRIRPSSCFDLVVSGSGSIPADPPRTSV